MLQWHSHCILLDKKYDILLSVFQQMAFFHCKKQTMRKYLTLLHDSLMFSRLLSMTNLLILGDHFFSCRKNLSLIRGDDLSQVISENAPTFCSVYVIGDGKLQQLRPADSEQNVITVDETSNLSTTSTDSSSSSSSLTIGTSA